MLRIAALAAIAAAIFAPTATAGVGCSTDAAAAVAGAAVNGPRAGWDPPVWTFDMPSLNLSVDVQAYDRPSAAAKAQTWLQGQVDAACAAENPVAAPAPSPGAPAPSEPTADETDAARTLVASAEVVYVGNSWGPLPIWRVNLPNLNLSIDAAAASADAARQAVVPFVAARLTGQATPTPGVVGEPTATVPATGGIVVAGAAPLPTVNDPKRALPTCGRYVAE